MSVNKFDMYGIAQPHSLDDTEIQDLIDQLQEMNTEGKLVWNSHIYYLDYKKFKFNPILVNVVRDPVQRIISKERPILLHNI